MKKYEYKTIELTITEALNILKNNGFNDLSDKQIKKILKDSDGESCADDDHFDILCAFENWITEQGAASFNNIGDNTDYEVIRNKVIINLELTA